MLDIRTENIYKYVDILNRWIYSSVLNIYQKLFRCQMRNHYFFIYSFNNMNNICIVLFDLLYINKYEYSVIYNSAWYKYKLFIIL